ncbi:MULTISPECIES: YrzI family small protein [Bacillus]|uniref:Uncharacterized protein (TIGR02413 family) n=1 Tax=Bacillus capparidis TaxID=1840411 RepID=A0ABS4CTI3_9BACI|nr:MULTISPECIES: YrzI family small protein [Bacillus]MBP1080883.1 uncharacterized protein (TIGR02413 family) [Bacillus capparidis]MED1097523.1 YrzI family small protein [Bacillus capparidis]
MTINLFFLTLTIHRRFKSAEEYERELEVQRIYEEMKDKQIRNMNYYNIR